MLTGIKKFKNGFYMIEGAKTIIEIVDNNRIYFEDVYGYPAIKSYSEIELYGVIKNKNVLNNMIEDLVLYPKKYLFFKSKEEIFDRFKKCPVCNDTKKFTNIDYCAGGPEFEVKTSEYECNFCKNKEERKMAIETQRDYLERNRGKMVLVDQADIDGTVAWVNHLEKKVKELEQEREELLGALAKTAKERDEAKREALTYRETLKKALNLLNKAERKFKKGRFDKMTKEDISSTRCPDYEVYDKLHKYRKFGKPQEEKTIKPSEAPVSEKPRRKNFSWPNLDERV